MTLSALLLHLLALLVVTEGSLTRKYQGHGSLWKEFETLYRASKDMGGGGEVKVNGLPPVVLSALAERIGSHAPSTRIHRAGCVASAEQLVGPSARGTYDLLLPPDTDGKCRAPSLSANANLEQRFTMEMEWRGESMEKEAQKSALPTPQEVFDAVFARKNGKSIPARANDHDPALSFWLLSFVNWFHDDNFRTMPNTDGAFTWSDQGSLHLVQLYGHTEYRQRALRTMTGDGKMKTSSQLGWDSYPPLLKDIQVDFPEFDMWTSSRGSHHASTSAGQTQAEADENRPHYFAIGDPRFNMHPGHIMWTSVALFLHNSACDILGKEDPLFSDEDIFQRARVMVFHIIQKIRLQDFVTDSVASTRDYIRIPYNPKALREHFAPHFPYSGGHKPNFLEFNHVYQAWHSLIPDNLVLNGDQVPLRQTMWSPQLFSNYTIGEMALSFAKTPLTRYAPHNFPLFLRGATEAAIGHERAQRMPSYNTYRQFVGMEPLSSFDQLAVDDPAELAALYDDDIDNLEFLTGVVADSNPELPGNFFGDVQLIVVALFALQDVSSNALILNPLMWSTDFLTEGGLAFVQDFEFRDLLANLTGQSHPCSFRTPGSPCIEAERWKEPDEVGSCFLHSARVCSYVGVDLTDWFWYENGYMRLYYLLTVMSMAGMVLLYMAVFALFSYLWPMESRNQTSKPFVRNELSTEPLPSTLGPSPSAVMERMKVRADLGTFHGSSSSSDTDEAEKENGLRLRQRRGSYFNAFLEGSNDGNLARERRNNLIFMQRMRLCTLTVSVLLSVGLLVPTTVVWITMVSDPYWIQNYAESTYLFPGLPYAIVGCHFMCELMFRLAQLRVSQSSSLIFQLALHHLGYFMAGILAISTADVAIYKMGYTVLVGWTWEWPLFTSFLGVRVFDSIAANQATKKADQITTRRCYRAFVMYCMPAMILIYFATRVLETIYLGMLVVCSVQRKAATGPVIAQATVMSISVVLQFYAGYILVLFTLRRRKDLISQTMGNERPEIDKSKVNTANLPSEEDKEIRI